MSMTELASDSTARGARTRRRDHDGILPWLAAPALVFFVGFAAIPLVGVFVLSFTTWDGIGAIVPSGLDSWRSVLTDPGLPHSLLVTFNGQTCNQQEVTLTLTNVHDTLGNTLASAQTNGCFLIGDVNGDGHVGSGDIGNIQGHLGEGTDSSNFRDDINADGRINNQDVQTARAHRGESLQE